MKFRIGLLITIGTAVLAGCATETYSEPDLAVVQSCAETSEYDRNIAVKAADALIADAKIHNTALGFAEFGDQAEPESLVRPRIIWPPIVNFPTCAASVGVEGHCEIYFNVLANGKPDQITPVCTHRTFSREAERAIRSGLYAPATVDGQAVEYRGIVQPIRFKLEDSYNPASTDADAQ